MTFAQNPDDEPSTSFSLFYSVVTSFADRRPLQLVLCLLRRVLDNKGDRFYSHALVKMGLHSLPLPRLGHLI